MSKRNTGGDDRRSCYPSSLTDEMWAVLAPLMPVRDHRKGGVARKYGDRLVLDAILFVLRSGCQWRMIPRDLLPWDAAYRWYRTWTAEGVFDRIHTALRDQARAQDGRDPCPSAAVLDAQSIKTSEGGLERGYDAGKKTTGRKRHLIVDTQGLLLTVMVTAASVQDRGETGGREILRRLKTLFPLIGLVWADGGYGSPKGGGMEAWARHELDLELAIVKRTDTTPGFRILPRRWVVERTFGWLIRHRRLARDYERLPNHSESMITLAMIRLMTTRLTNQTTHWSHINKPTQ